MAKKQTKRPNLPDNDRVVRRCGNQKLDRDPVTGEVRGVIPQAMVLRPGELYISTSWLEFHNGTDIERLKAVLSIYRAAKIAPGPNSAFMLMRVEEILKAGVDRGKELRVTHRPSKNDPAYAPLEGLPFDNSDIELLDALCRTACTGVHVIRDIDAAK